MKAEASPGAGRRRRSRARPVALVALVVVVGAVLWAALSPSAGAPYGPANAGPQGAKGLDLLLGRLGVVVDTSGRVPRAGRGVVLVLQDQLNDASRAQLLRWVGRGGALVVADPLSPLAAAAVAQGLPNQPLLAPGALAPACRAPWTAGVALIDPGPDPLLEVAGGTKPCFAQDTNAFALARRHGRGEVVALGGPDLWSNALLGHQDNALLAADLLASSRGATVAWLTLPRLAGGDETLWGLVPWRVKVFLVTAAAALVVACAAQARRLGRYVAEDPVVPVPASELVAATGRLMALNLHYQAAVSLLREQACRELKAGLGQPAEAPAATVARVAALRAGLPVDETVATLAGPLPANEDQLMPMAVAVQRLRGEALGEHRD